MAKRIVYNVVEMMKGRTVVFATSNHKLLEYFDYHLTLEESP